jgi:hypothetical protein
MSDNNQKNAEEKYCASRCEEPYWLFSSVTKAPFERLGLRRMHQTVEHADSPTLRGHAVQGQPPGQVVEA